MLHLWTALLILDMPVAAPTPAPVVEVIVLLDSTERSAGLRHEIEWSRDPYHPRHRYASTDGIRWQIVEWESIPSFRIASIPAWRDSRYVDWQPVTWSGDGSGILKIADAVRRDDREYDQWLKYIGGTWVNPPRVPFEEWKPE